MIADSPTSLERTASRAGIGRARRLTILALGVLAMSTSSVLVRLAEAPSLVVGAWRLGLAWAMITPWALPRARRELRRLNRRGLLLVFGSAVALAGHFGFWISSLSRTTVASSVVLVTTTPIYVALASRFLLGEAVSRRRAAAVAVAMAGSAAIGYGDMRVSGEALWGDLLAVLGAVSMAAHLMIGQAVRRRLSTPAYIWPVYGLAALILTALCLASGQPLVGYGPRTYAMVTLLALVPQVMGHSTFSWALAHVSPLFLTLAVLGEPIGASVLALLLLREAPPAAVFVGGPLILIGIYMASREEKSAPQPGPPDPEGAPTPPGAAP